MILFGHPTGNPNSHHAALAHMEAGRLAAFCVPWFPSPGALAALGTLPPLRGETARLTRRSFAPLNGAPKIQGRCGEWGRLLRRKLGGGGEALAYEANDWLMRTMARECLQRNVTAVHSYEDCSLWQFEEAKRAGKPCVYDMPIGYYPWWEEKQKELAKAYSEWIPTGGVPSSRYVRPEQKVKEMELADVVLVACGFVEKTIREFLPDKNIAIAPYGVDAEFWSPRGDEEKRQKDKVTKRPQHNKIKFIYAGQSSIRKGIPVLLEAWEKAALRDAELLLVGSWQLAHSKLKHLPRDVCFIGPVGPAQLRALYRESDVFVFPSFFEGFGLVLLEAMACGLPVIASDRSAGPMLVDPECGRLVRAGVLQELEDSLRWFGLNREQLPRMKKAARGKAETFTWAKYRVAVSDAVRPFV